MISAFVFLTAEAGLAKSISDDVGHARLDGAKVVRNVVVLGRYDVIVELAAESQIHVEKAVDQVFQQIEGVSEVSYVIAREVS